MNDNEINVLLDHFVGGLDAAESSSVTKKINTHPQWSKTYKQLNLIFGSLNALKEENSQLSAPEGLASKTFQKILDKENNRRNSSEFVSQKAILTEQTVQSKSGKRFLSVKPSFLALSACAGFLLVFALASMTFHFRNSSTNNLNSNTRQFVNNSVSPNLSFDITLPEPNTSANFAVTGFAVTGMSQQPSSSLYFCSNATSEATAANPFKNNIIAINSSDQLSRLTPGSDVAASSSNEKGVSMAYPNNIVNLTSQPETQPIILVQPQPVILVQPPHLPGELNNIQDVFNLPNVNFVVPVNSQK